MAGKSKNEFKAVGDGADARWTLRGVPKNFRNIATKRANELGKPLGAYIALLITADRSGDVMGEVKKNVPAPLDLAPKGLDELINRIKALEKSTVRKDPPSTMMSNEAADYLNMKSRRTLDRMRWKCEGPKFYKVAGMVQYDKVDLDEWREQQKKKFT